MASSEVAIVTVANHDCFFQHQVIGISQKSLFRSMESSYSVQMPPVQVIGFAVQENTVENVFNEIFHY